MPRSASTWAYNVVLALLRQTAVGEIHSGYDDNLDRFLRGVPAAASHAVAKSHFLDPTAVAISQLGAAKVVYTWRPLPDAIASYMVMFGVDFEGAIDVMSKAIDVYCHHRRCGSLVLRYQDITAEPAPAVRKIAAHLQLKASEAQISAIAEATSLASMRAKAEEIASPGYCLKLNRHDGLSYDPETMLHVNHIRNGDYDYGRKMLRLDQLQKLRRLLVEKGALECG